MMYPQGNKCFANRRNHLFDTQAPLRKRVPKRYSNAFSGTTLALTRSLKLEVHSLLKEIEAVGDLNQAGSLPQDVLARVARIMQQAVQEARNIVVGARGHGTKNRAN